MILLRLAPIFLFLIQSQVASADCTSPAGVAGKIIYDSGRFKGCDGTDWKYLDEAPSSGVTTCPTNFSRVGPSGGTSSFCITTAEQSNVGYLVAKDNCHNLNTGGLGYAYMCTANEWYIACTKGADTGQTALTNMTGNREWVADFTGDPDPGYDYAMALGNSTCSTIDYRRFDTQTARYRCCFR